ncbi:hypothetical protein D9M71_33740 [compost metagenome]
MKKTVVLIALSFAALIGLSGCKEKGDEFIGTWIRVDNKFDNSKEDSLVVRRDDGLFHIDRKHWGLMRKYETERVQARAESDNVLSIINSNPLFGTMTITLQNGSLITSKGAEYKRTQ